MTEVEPVPCVGCGYCCRKARCYLGAMIYGPGRDCPGLVEVHGRWRCRHVVEAKGDHFQLLCLELHIGAGCCSGMNTERLKYEPLSECRCRPDDICFCGKRGKQ